MATLTSTTPGIELLLENFRPGKQIIYSGEMRRRAAISLKASRRRRTEVEA
jgi:hypothetical protein